MQKKKRLKTSKIMMMVCALMLVFGAVVAVNNGVEAVDASEGTPVTYLKGDGPKEGDVTLAKDSDSWSIGKNKLADAPTCKDNTFTFIGWVEVKEDGTIVSEKTYDAGAEYEITVNNSGAHKFKAIWGVKVTFDKNLDDPTENVTGPTEDKAVYGEDYIIDSDVAFTATNYEFLGWSTEAKKDSAEPEFKYADTDNKIKADAPIKLYAIWKAKFLRVTYHANTGSDATDSSVTVPVDSTKYMGEGDGLVATIMGDGKLASDHVHAATMKDAIPVRTGYTFAGWATTATATKAEYKPGEKINPMTKDVDLYAVWTSGTAATTGTTSGSGTTTTTKTPQTGDNDYLYLYIVMAVLSLVGIAYLCYDQKKAKASK